MKFIRNETETDFRTFEIQNRDPEFLDVRPMTTKWSSPIALLSSDKVGFIDRWGQEMDY